MSKTIIEQVEDAIAYHERMLEDLHVTHRTLVSLAAGAAKVVNPPKTPLLTVRKKTEFRKERAPIKAQILDILTAATAPVTSADIKSQIDMEGYHSNTLHTVMHDLVKSGTITRISAGLYEPLRREVA
jgi:hypothetical protein